MLKVEVYLNNGEQSMLNKLFIVTAFIVCLSLSSLSVFAATLVTYTGDISEGRIHFDDPHWGTHSYDSQQFTVDQEGSYDMRVIGTSPYFDTYYYLYIYDFDTTDTSSNLIAWNDDDSSLSPPTYSRIVYSLLPSTNYYLVSMTWSSVYPTEGFITNQISGPGNIYLDVLAITDLTVSGNTDPFNSPYDLGGNLEEYDNVFMLDGSLFNGSLIANTGFIVEEGTISADLAGGYLVKTTVNTATLSGTNTYTGGTAIDGGVLQVYADENLGDASGNISYNGGTLRYLDSFDTSRDMVLNLAGGTIDTNGYNSVLLGDISGPGPLSKIGEGILTLEGTNTYTYGTTVYNGVLLVNGPLASGILNTIDGTLGGNGSIAGVVTNQGTIAPGNSIDTLVVGNYVSEAGSTYEVEVDGDGYSDLIAATGTATLTGGFVDVIATGILNDYGRQTYYNVVSATGVSGTYDSVSVNWAELTPFLLYNDPTLVQLGLLRNDIDFAEIAGAETDNQLSVAAVLSAASQSTFTGEINDVLNLFVDDLDEEGRRQALDQLGGQSLHTAVPFASFGLMETFQGAVGNRMAYLHQAGGGQLAKADPLAGVMLAMAGDVTNVGPISGPKEKNNNVWANLYTLEGDVDADLNAAGYDYDVSGAALGVDFEVCQGIHLGLTAGYGQSNVDTDTSDNADIDSVQFGVYGNYEAADFYLDGMIAYAQNDYETKRQMTIEDLSRIAKGDYAGDEWSVAAEFGRLFTIEGYNVQPFFGTRYIYLDEDGFTETGAGDLSLEIDDRSTTSWKVFPGLRVNRPVVMGEQSYFVPELFAKMILELEDKKDVVSSSLTGAPAAGDFQVEGIDLDRDSYELGGGLNYLNGPFQLSLNYAAEINDAKTTHLVTGGFQMLW